VDYIALSFVQRPEDILELKRLLTEQKKNEPKTANSLTPSIPKIVAKIEKPQALDCIDDILKVVDVIMVARGDLGVESSLESVPIHQKMLIAKANAALVPVITATQMLETMISSSSPSRAEVSDVANAVYDGTDAVMLSGETAIGRYPVETVSVMSKILHAVDKAQAVAFVHRESISHRLLLSHNIQSAANLDHAIAYSAYTAGMALQAKVLVVQCLTYGMAVCISKLRPICPVVAITYSCSQAQLCALCYGVVPLTMPYPQNSTFDRFILEMEELLLSNKTINTWLKPGDLYVLFSGSSAVLGASHTLKIRHLGDPIETPLETPHKQ